MQHPQTTRVLLTNVNDDGTSSFTERFIEAITEYDADGHALFMGTVLWGTADGVPTVGPGENPDMVKDTWYPGPGGTRFNFFTFLPQTSDGGDIDRYQTDDNTTGRDTEMPGLAASFDAARPGMHISDTVDLVHVLSGEMYMVLDHDEVLVRAGDVIIMRGGWHGWRNERSEPCTVAGVNIGAHRSGA